ncbi:MAG: ion channel [Halioglobus sp.]
MKTVTTENNFTYLTGSLIVLLFSSAVIDSLPEDVTHLSLQAIVVLTFVIAYQSLNFGRVWRQFVAMLVALLILASIARELSDSRVISFLELVVMLLFFVGAAYRSSRQVLFSGGVDRNIIVGSIAIYLLLGLIWAMLYLMALELSATAFSGIAGQDWVENFPAASYFSYVTLTTLGYGEISPAEPLSRVLVYLQAITGTFYMAIVVASLVGAQKNNSKH